MTHVYVYQHVYIYLYTHIFICTYVTVYMYLCMCIYVCIYICILLYSHVFMYIYVIIILHYPYIHVHTFTYSIYSYVYEYISIHPRVEWKWLYVTERSTWSGKPRPFSRLKFCSCLLMKLIGTCRHGDMRKLSMQNCCNCVRQKYHRIISDWSVNFSQSSGSSSRLRRDRKKHILKKHRISKIFLRYANLSI